MKLKLHHINLSTNNVSGMDHFYRNVLGLKTATDGLPVLEKKKGYDGDVAFVSGGHIQTHLAQKDLHVGFRTGLVKNSLLPT
jgi:glyoxylase I family protein